MTDLAKTIAPKSDQLNADDLIAGPRTIRITEVRGSDDADQPIAIHFEGDDRKPYKPCKSMRRVLVHAWGADGKTYAGRLATLYCDPDVQFGGIKVGGIRISHLSHIERDMTVPLMVTRGQRRPYTVKALKNPAPDTTARQSEPAGAARQQRQDEATAGLVGSDFDPVAWAAEFNRSLDGFETAEALEQAWTEAKTTGRAAKLKGRNPDLAQQLVDAVKARLAEIRGGGQ